MLISKEETWGTKKKKELPLPWWIFWWSFWQSSLWRLWRKPLVELLVEFTLGEAWVHGYNPYTIFLLLSTQALLLSSLLYSHITSTPLCPMYMIHQ